MLSGYFFYKILSEIYGLKEFGSEKIEVKPIKPLKPLHVVIVVAAIVVLVGLFIVFFAIAIKSSGKTTDNEKAAETEDTNKNSEVQEREEPESKPGSGVVSAARRAGTTASGAAFGIGASILTDKEIPSTNKLRKAETETDNGKKNFDSHANNNSESDDETAETKNSSMIEDSLDSSKEISKTVTEDNVNNVNSNSSENDVAAENVAKGEDSIAEKANVGTEPDNEDNKEEEKNEKK